MNSYKSLLKDTQRDRGNRARTDLDAYLAGFFDGEGHISIRKDPRRAWSCYVDIGATQVNREPLRLLVRAYGGKVNKKTKGKGKSKQCYVWKCSKGGEALWALHRMLPWLRVKRVKARAALIVLANRPLQCAGGQISKFQKMAITKALRGLHVIEIGERRRGCRLGQNRRVV